MNIKRLIKNRIASCLFYTGAMHSLARVRFKNKAFVLMYHRVVTEKENSNCLSQDGIVVSKAVFEKQMRFLINRFNVLSLNEFIECIEERKTFRPNSCLVTFDDGWKDNYQNAYPLLKEMGIPATIFVTTDFVGENKLFWQERITGLLYGLHDALESDRDVSRYVLRDFPDMEIRRLLKCERDRLKEEISGYIRMLKGKANEEIEERIRRLAILAVKVKRNVDEESAFMDWDAIKVMAKNGISFGSHGKSHAILTRLGKCEIEKEALESRELIEKKLGVPVCSFSYPNGDYSEEIAEILRNSGYRVAFSADKGHHSIDDHPYKVRRINIHEDMTHNIPMFLARITGLW